MYIDTHTHLHLEQFDKDREVVIQRAIKNKVDAIIDVGTDPHTSEQALLMSDKFAVIHAAVGIHPNECQNFEPGAVEKIRELAGREKVVAIGEIGLDYYRMGAEREKQIEFFQLQLRLALELQLPVIIHNRDAHQDILHILKKEKISKVGVVLHSFSGTEDFLENVLEENFYVSFTGVITFKNTNYYKLIERVPPEQLLLETDSPFLAPAPFRGKRNEPSYIKYAAEKIAKVKGISPKELALITSENATTLFQMKI